MSERETSTEQNAKRIHIFGASGSGTTTLGSALAVEYGCAFFDADDYFWKVKYSEIQERNARLEILLGDLEGLDRWVLSGSLCGWGDPIIPRFDLAIFLYLPHDIRMQRLEERERSRYGDAILPGHPQHKIYSDFMVWASRYDEGDEAMRSLKLHEAWVKTLSCPVLRIFGDYGVAEKIEMARAYINDATELSK